jgi:hypothetical protein
MVLGISFLFAWMRLKSGSVWTGMLLHASHNLFVQAFFDAQTRPARVTCGPPNSAQVLHSPPSSSPLFSMPSAANSRRNASPNPHRKLHPSLLPPLRGLFTRASTASHVFSCAI